MSQHRRAVDVIRGRRLVWLVGAPLQSTGKMRGMRNVFISFVLSSFANSKPDPDRSGPSARLLLKELPKRP